MKIATDTQLLSNLVKYELFPEFGHCRDVLTYNGEAKDFAIGDLVAADGTVPKNYWDVVGIVVQNTTAAAATDTAVIVLARGAAGVSQAGIKLGAFSSADVKEHLRNLGIKVLTAI
jgi:hypothetical protein